MDTLKNEDVTRLCSVKKALKRHMDERDLDWYRHVERRTDYRLVRKIYSSTLEGTQRRGRPRKR